MLFYLPTRRCRPTSSAGLVRSGMCIRTLKDVAKGEELCISYGPLRENSTVDRRRAALVRPPWLLLSSRRSFFLASCRDAALAGVVE